MALLSIKSQNKQISEHDIQKFEEKIGVSLPHDYRIFLLDFNGGQPSPDTFPIFGHKTQPFAGIQVFYGLSTKIITSDLVYIIDQDPHLVPKGILPIACTEGIDEICIRISGHAGQIVYWDKQKYWGKNEWDDQDFFYVAYDFNKFLNLLYDFDSHKPT